MRLAVPARAVDPAALAAGGADVLLIDAGPRPAEAVLRALPRASRLPRIALLADDLSRAAFTRLMRLGVRALLPHGASPDEIAAAIEAVAAGLVVLHPSMSAVSAGPAEAGRGSGTIDSPPPRDLEVLAMMAEGMGNRAIAQQLGISTHTVKFHVAAILDKLRARSRTEAVTSAMRRGLLMV